MSRVLRRGYTTGVHTLFAFCSALGVFVRVGGVVVAKNKKIDNDDLDITKGAEIVVTIAPKKELLTLNPTPHQPYTFGKAKIFAGVGVGVVTKDGLKPPKNYPAINPTPLKELKRCYELLGEKREIFCAVSVTNGEELAKQTANPKVGVVGGISILGSSGWVKPVSNEAFLDSIKTEIKVALADGFSEIVFSLGNNSLKRAKEKFKETQIVEIGNFIYDSFKIAKELGAERVILFVGAGKALKIAQGFKNTHNRFGGIDFEALKKEIKRELSFEIDTDSTKTLKGVLEQLREKNLDEKLKKLIKKEAIKRLKEWFDGLDVEVVLV